MNEIAISVKNLSKKYRIGGPARHNTIRDQIDDFIHHPFGIGREMATSEDFWALKDVSFDIKKGDVVGVIGRNGSGKSTLLKILSRIVEPTIGKVTMYGRVASLLEVGTGFNPDLTGRENIFLNGSILGMSQKEIAGKFDEIVAFSGVEQFIDTPVKRYSSGMYVRLAFAVAAHLDSDILLVDEVLAVGDAEFQKKCLGKMDSLAKSGKTVLFVSHDMGAISTLCKKTVWVDKGIMVKYSTNEEVLRLYHKQWQRASRIISSELFDGPLQSFIRFNKILVNGLSEEPVLVAPAETVKLTAYGDVTSELKVFYTTFSLYRDGVRVLTTHDVNCPTPLLKGPFLSSVEIPANFLRPGDYMIAVGGHTNLNSEWIYGENLISFSIESVWSEHNLERDIGVVNVKFCGRRTYL